jgi:Entner-Doudoroff aldolase
MTSSEPVVAQIESARVIAILRGDYRERGAEIVGALLQGGLTAVEVTLNSPGAFELIGRLAREFGGRMAVGAGTVLKTDEVRKAFDAGAKFIVSPNRNAAVIQTTKRHGLASVPGCFTPSEIVEALDAGADAAKLFPASCLGPGFVRAMRGPVANVRMVPTGGVTPELARAYRAAGAWAVGVGSELVGPDALKPGGLDRLVERAAAFVAAMRAEGA